MTYTINKVAIIGAGTMGSGIAAHLANIGIEVLLLDIVTPGLQAREKEDRAARNRLVQGLYDRMKKAKPANLARSDRARFIHIGNIEDDFEKISESDWIIEVIIEQLDPKQSLMERIERVRKADSIVSSNTSGIPIQKIAEGRSDNFQAHFLGTHFFNPPRYLKLLEIITTAKTAPEVLDFIVRFGSDTLGKGVVICKDTPNFIGNRFFAIANSYGVNYAWKHGYSVEEVDAITGPLIGRPKTATFRLLDLVGLDVMGHVSNNLYDAIPDDPYRNILRSERSHEVIDQMLENKWLGNKSGQGFYKKTFVNGKREFWTLDPEIMEYTAPKKARFDSVGAVRKIESLQERLPSLLEQDEDRAVEYVRDTLFYSLAYAAEVAPHIAFSLVDVDNAMRWGFAHEAGPFQMWDMLGLKKTAEAMKEAGLSIADWVQTMLKNGHESFYRDGHYYDYETMSYRPLVEDARTLTVQQLRDNEKTVEKNMSASLLDMGDGVALLELRSPKINALDIDFLDMTELALARLNSDFDALVIGNNGQDFCVGMNLAVVLIAASQGLWDQLEQTFRRGQQLFFQLRHAPKPVVTAPHQRVLGGGVELTMAGWSSVADHETYMGFIELGAGVIPGAGGCKELLTRKVNPVMRTQNADVVPILQEVFEQIALAKVGTSAWEDKAMGYLQPEDEIVMDSDHRLLKAKQKALALVHSGARPPEVEKVFAAGRDVLAALQLGLQSFVWAGYASEYDQVLGNKLAYILCGGDISAPAWVEPSYILDLELEANLSLVGEPLTQARMSHLLQTGKPLRN
jgi:3-hydroxyacyl-CoA dehydrogenase